MYEGMNTRPMAGIQGEREAMFLGNMDAFMRRDFATIEGSMRSDIVLELPGTSWLAGSYLGDEEVSRSIVSLRRVFDSEKKQLSFLHEGDQMIVRHDIMVHGPMHEVEMALRVSVRYDPAGKMEAITVAPDDLALFDHVLNTALRNSEAS
jgi:hypothetical protein